MPDPDPRGLVLVVEDDRAIADLVRLYLRKDGFGVQVETDGAAALDAVGRLHPVAVVLDIGLPGMDGYELARRLRGAFPDIRLIALTGYGQASDQQAAMAAGFDAHCAKPVTMAVLLDLIS